MNNNIFQSLKSLTSKIGSGATPSGGQSNYKKEGISLIRSQNVLDMSFSKDGLAFINEDQAKKLNNVEVFENDILLNITGDSIGRVCRVPKEILPARVNQHVSILRSNALLDPDFLLYYLIYKKKYLLTISRVGGTRNALTKEAIEKLEIRIDKNQQKIAAVLSALDNKIELNNKINTELETMAKTLYDYWFVQFDFPNTEDKPYKTSGGKMFYNETLKREIPEGWEVKELNEVAKIIMGQSPKGESYNEDGNGVLLINGAADYEVNYLKPKIYTSSPTRLCNINDLVFCIRATIGKLTYAEQEFCLGRGVAGVRVNTMNYSEYIFYSLNQEIERFKKHASGSIIVGITKEDLVNYNVLIPKEDILNNFQKMVNPIHSKIRMNLKQNQELAQLRDWLLPMLMNGQVTVTGAKDR